MPIFACSGLGRAARLARSPRCFCCCCCCTSDLPEMVPTRAVSAKSKHMLTVCFTFNCRCEEGMCLPDPLCVVEENCQASFKTALCKYYELGHCTRGSGCTFAHGTDELVAGAAASGLSTLADAVAWSSWDATMINSSESQLGPLSSCCSPLLLPGSPGSPTQAPVASPLLGFKQ